MSRESESRPKYGVIGAGGIGKSLIGRLPGKARDVGPVAGLSFRVASRIANALRAGYPVRSTGELNRAGTILFHAPPDQAAALMALLESAPISWKGKALVFCDCDANPVMRTRLGGRGASTAVLRQFGIAGRIVVEGEGVALKVVRRIARALRLRAVGISAGSSDLFDAGVVLGTCALTPLIDRAAAILRQSGVRDHDAARLASALFEQTAREYAHSGRQSWKWHLQKPDAARLEAQISAEAGAGGEPVGALLRELLLLGFDTFDRHADVARLLRQGFIDPSA